MPPEVSPPQPLIIDKNVTENWRLCKQVWADYVIIAGLGKAEVPYITALFLHTIGVDVLRIYNGMKFETGESNKKPVTLYQNLILTFWERPVLRNMAKTCEFCECMNEKLIMERIILGVLDDRMREKLISLCNSCGRKNHYAASSLCKASKIHAMAENEQGYKCDSDDSFVVSINCVTVLVTAEVYSVQPDGAPIFCEMEV
jgi:hypothetical protein